MSLDTFPGNDFITQKSLFVNQIVLFPFLKKIAAYYNF